jgi:hypothetical protein
MGDTGLLIIIAILVIIIVIFYFINNGRGERIERYLKCIHEWQDGFQVDLNIKNEIYKLFENLGAKSDILSTIGSYKETQSDEAILLQLKQLNFIYESEKRLEKSYIVKWQDTFWHVCFDEEGNYKYLLSCTHGYNHGVTFEEVQKMEVVGSLKDFKHLLKCD